MKKKLKKLEFYIVIKNLLAISVIIILISLGCWQISRLKEKELFLSKMENNLNSTPINIKSLNSDIIYAKITMRGHFLYNKDIYLYGRKSMSTEKDGYYLVTPFQTDDDKIIMVARGWFSGRHKKMIGKLIDKSNTEIVGVILPSEKTRLFVPSNDTLNNVWFTLDLQQASDILGLKLENFYVMMDNGTMRSDILKPLSIRHLVHIRNNHLEYAITWFALAIALIVISIIYHSRKKRENIL